MIPAKTCYKTYNQEILAIVGVFTICCHYLESRKFKVHIVFDYNKLFQFMDAKNLSFKQV